MHLAISLFQWELYAPWILSVFADNFAPPLPKALQGCWTTCSAARRDLPALQIVQHQLACQSWHRGQQPPPCQTHASQPTRMHTSLWQTTNLRHCIHITFGRPWIANYGCQCAVATVTVCCALQNAAYTAWQYVIDACRLTSFSAKHRSVARRLVVIRL